VLNSTATVEFIQTYNDKTFFIRNENLLQTGFGADGRPRFAGNAAASNNAATARYPDFLNLYHISNIDTGSSRYVSFSLDRPLRDRWAANLSYTRGRSTDAQIFGSTTAGSQWGRNAVFYQNSVVESRSDFEVRDRVQLSYTRQFNFLKERSARTLVSLYYEGRTGNPYSWVYSNDLNGDALSGNDLVAVPNGTNDPRFNFTGMSPEALNAYFAFLDESGLSQYAGGYAPRNSHDQPWVNRLDLRLSQDIPLRGRVKLELFADFTNFGSFIAKSFFNYHERTTLVESDTFWRRNLGQATYGTDGRIQLATANALAPTGIVFDNPQSRWKLQIGARLKF
jgi:hypothetical protein